MPAGHSVHRDAPTPLAYDPGVQDWHALALPWPLMELNVPAAHLVHTVELAAPTTLDHVPTPQGTHDVAPLCTPYVPAPHGVHCAREVAPRAVEKVPCGQADEHTLAPTPLAYDPGAQDWHALASPWPLSALNVPAAHLVHTS